MLTQKPTVIDFFVFLGKKLLAVEKAGIPYTKGGLSEINAFERYKPLENFLGEMTYANGGHLPDKDMWLWYLVLYCEQGAILDFVTRRVDQTHPLGLKLCQFLRPRIDLMLQVFKEVLPIIWGVLQNRRKDSQSGGFIQLGWLDRWKLKQSYQKIKKAVPTLQEIQSMGELSDVLVQLFDLPGAS